MRVRMREGDWEVETRWRQGPTACGLATVQPSRCSHSPASEEDLEDTPRAARCLPMSTTLDEHIP